MYKKTIIQIIKNRKEKFKKKNAFETIIQIIKNRKEKLKKKNAFDEKNKDKYT